MRLSTIGVRNVLRTRLRSLMTVAGVAVAILAFVLLQTVLHAWTVAADFAAKDRVVTRHKVSFIMSMPERYLSDVAQVPGVTQIARASWFGGKDPSHPDDFFNTLAVDPTTIFQVYDEIVVPPDDLAAFQQNRRAAVVGDSLAKKLGWKKGDKVTLQGTIFPGDWQFEIAGIYTATRKSVDRSTFYFHYDYLNEWLKETRPSAANQVGWIVSRVDKSQRPVEVAKAIDAHFDSADIQTMSQDERAFNTSFLGMIGAVLKALDVVSLVIMAIMMLILGNTMAMGVRERTNEYGVLRAIGYLPKHLVFFVLGEAATIGFIGGAGGVLLSYPIVEQGLGRFLEENMGGFFPYFRIAPATASIAVALSVGLGILAALVPAIQASRLDVVTSLRKVG
jgi:putative ABC transport system permease protein